MKTSILITAILIWFSISTSFADDKTVNALLQSYAVTNVNIEQGKLLWKKKYKANGEFSLRSCATCHTEDLTKPGKHVKTGKSIKPMSTSVNPQRLTSIKKIEKWFKRNCKWTMGRECTSQEKASLLLYIDNQTNF